VASPFGHPLTFAELLERLRARPDCVVILQDAGGIPDSPMGTKSGAMYYIERRTEDGQLHWAFVEGFHPIVAVLPDYLHAICTDLRLTEDDLDAKHRRRLVTAG